MNDTNLQELEETLSLLNNKVARNVSIVTAATLGQTELFHIAKEKFKELIPNVSKRAALTEDNTLPRVHVSPTLLGCINGYAGIVDDITSSPFDSKFHNYRGGYYVYYIPFDYALVPNKKLVYDAEVTGEHWLITYNKATKTFKPSSVGRIANVSISFIPTIEHKSTKQTIELAIEVPQNAKLHMEGTTWLFEGYWLVKLAREREGELFTLLGQTKINKKDFEKIIVEQTNKLSLERHQEVLKAW